MPAKKKAKRPQPRQASKSAHNRFVIFYILAGLLAFSFLFTQTRTWYFVTTQKEKVDFAETAYSPNDAVAIFNGEDLPVPQNDLVYAQQDAAVLGDSDPSNKRIEVDLTNQRVYAFEGDKKVYDFLVSTGKFNKTPTGEFTIWIKLFKTKMSGGSKALGTYYYLPNVPYVMFFYNEKYPKWQGYGFHGTYWHNNFGTPMSHGCINMKTEEAALLYYWASPDLQGKSSITASKENPGTKVIIYGIAPQS